MSLAAASGELNSIKSKRNSLIRVLSQAEYENEYQILFKLFPDVIYSISIKGTLETLSPAFEKITGWSVHEWIGKPFVGLIHPEDLPLALAKFKESLEGKTSDAYVLRVISKSGKYLYGEFTSVPRIVNGKIAGKIGIARDITERKEAEINNQKLAALVQFSDDAIIGKNLSSIITSWNKGAEKLFGYSAKEAVGQKIKIIFPKNKYHELEEIKEVTSLGESIDHLETVRKTKDGRLVDVSVTISPLKDGLSQVIGSSCINRDITITKELERRKDVFISMASHELKTPITSIKAYIQLLKNKCSQKNSDPTLVKFLNKTDEQVDQLTDLVNDLLDLSKIQTGKLELRKEKFCLGELIEETVENLQGISHGHEIVLEGSTDKEVVADKIRIKQVLINLINNAIKYSPKAQKVFVRVKSDDNNKVIIEVEDFGIGIARNHQRRIFDRFYRAAGESEKTFPGLGIGLYITSEIIKRHGGSIWVNSIKRKGSTFYFNLPLK